jgi:hypothetical protein
MGQYHPSPLDMLRQLHDKHICNGARLRDWTMPAHLADRGADMREMVAAIDQHARVGLRRRKDLNAFEPTPTGRRSRQRASWVAEL